MPPPQQQAASGEHRSGFGSLFTDGGILRRRQWRLAAGDAAGGGGGGRGGRAVPRVPTHDGVPSDSAARRCRDHRGHGRAPQRLRIRRLAGGVKLTAEHDMQSTSLCTTSRVCCSCRAHKTHDWFDNVSKPLIPPPCTGCHATWTTSNETNTNTVTMTIAGRCRCGGHGAGGARQRQRQRCQPGLASQRTRPLPAVRFCLCVSPLFRLLCCLTRACCLLPRGMLLCKAQMITIPAVDAWRVTVLEAAGVPTT